MRQMAPGKKREAQGTTAEPACCPPRSAAGPRLPRGIAGNGHEQCLRYSASCCHTLRATLSRPLGGPGALRAKVGQRRADEVSTRQKCASMRGAATRDEYLPLVPAGSSPSPQVRGRDLSTPAPTRRPRGLHPWGSRSMTWRTAPMWIVSRSRTSTSASSSTSPPAASSSWRSRDVLLRMF